jgi:hypothetical protein
MPARSRRQGSSASRASGSPVHGGIGFTAEHPLHHHVKRVLVLDGLLGSSRELIREAGRVVIAAGTAPRLIDL